MLGGSIVRLIKVDQNIDQDQPVQTIIIRRYKDMEEDYTTDEILSDDELDQIIKDIEETPEDEAEYLGDEELDDEDLSEEDIDSLLSSDEEDDDEDI